MLNENEIDEILIETVDMDDVEVIQYVYKLGYQQCAYDVDSLNETGMWII